MLALEDLYLGVHRLYPDILGLFRSQNWENILLFGNENSRCKLAKLGILHDFKNFCVVKGASFLSLEIHRNLLDTI